MSNVLSIMCPMSCLYVSGVFVFTAPKFSLFVSDFLSICVYGVLSIMCPMQCCVYNNVSEVLSIMCPMQCLVCNVSDVLSIMCPMSCL